MSETTTTVTSRKPVKLNLVKGAIRRGDTIEAWSATVSGIPNIEDAIVKFSIFPGDFSKTALLEYTSESGGEIEASVSNSVLSFTIPRTNVPAVGRLVWELQIRVPTVLSGQSESSWARTLFEGSIIAVQDGIERDIV